MCKTVFKAKDVSQYTSRVQLQLSHDLRTVSTIHINVYIGSSERTRGAAALALSLTNMASSGGCAPTLCLDNHCSDNLYFSMNEMKDKWNEVPAPPQQQQQRQRRRKKQIISVHRDKTDPTVWVEKYRDENGVKKKKLYKKPPTHMSTLQKLGMQSCSSKNNHNKNTKHLEEAEREWMKHQERRYKVNRERQKREEHLWRLQQVKGKALFDMEDDHEDDGRFRTVVRTFHQPDHPQWVALEEQGNFNIECAEGSIMPQHRQDTMLLEDDDDCSLDDPNAPCVVCAKQPRTHIALPCLHFAYCQGCVKRLHDQNVHSCLICNAPNVVYTKVQY